jgi:O-antigen ligase
MIYSFGLAALCVAWLIPGHFFPWTGFQQETAAGIGALLLATAVLASTVLPRLPVPRIAVAAFALAVIPMAQWVGGMVPYLADAALSSLYLCAFGLTVVAAAALTQSSPRTFVMGVMGCLFAGALASNSIGYAQWLQVAFEVPMEQLSAGARVYANFTQPNHQATLLGLGVVASIWLFEKRHIGRIGIALLLAFFGFGIVLTQSRTGWAFAAVLMLWWLMARQAVPLRMTAGGVVTALVGFVALTSILAPLNAVLDIGTATSLAERATTVGARRINWGVVWDAVWARPWLGWGWMRVGEAQQATTLNHAPSHEWITFSHNIVLDLLIWNGALIGALICAGVAAWAVKRCMRCRDADTWAMLAAGGVLLTHALLEFPHAYAYFLLPMAVFIGVIESRQVPVAGATASMSKWTFGAAAALMASMLVWTCVEYLDIEEAGRRQRFKEAGYVSKGDQPYLPRVSLLDNQREFLWFRMSEAKVGMSDADLERMRQVQQRFMPPAVLLRYAIATGLNDQPDEAQRSLQLVCHMWPRKNCDEGRENWSKLQAQHPKLMSIAFPADLEVAPRAGAPPFGD